MTRETTPRRPSKTEQLISELVARGGVMRLDHSAYRDGVEQLATSARRYGKVPAGLLAPQ